MAIKNQANQDNKSIVTILAEEIPMGVKPEAETNQEQPRSVEGEYQRSVENTRAEIRQTLNNRDIEVKFTSSGLISYPSYREISSIVDDYEPEHHALVTSILQEEYNDCVKAKLLHTKEQGDKIGVVVAASAIAEVRSNFRDNGITNMEVRPWIIERCSELLATILADYDLPEHKQKELMEDSVEAANRNFQKMFQQRMILCADFQHAV